MTIRVLNELRGEITAKNTFDILRRHILVDGFPIVVDLEKSRGSHLYDSHNQKLCRFSLRIWQTLSW